MWLVGEGSGLCALDACQTGCGPSLAAGVKGLLLVVFASCSELERADPGSLAQRSGADGAFVLGAGELAALHDVEVCLRVCGASPVAGVSTIDMKAKRCCVAARRGVVCRARNRAV